MLTFDIPQNKKAAAAQDQKLKKGILTEANYTLTGNDTIVRYCGVDIQGVFFSCGRGTVMMVSAQERC